MRSVCLFFVLLIALCATATATAKASVAEICPKDKCVPANQCDFLWKGAKCEGSGKTCCSVLKRGFRTTCGQHGGECMNWCNEDLRREVGDQCPAGTMCCVLI